VGKFGQIWVNFEGLRWENVDLVYGHLENFTDVRDIVRPFGTFCAHLVHFVLIWCILCSFGAFCAHLVHLVLIWCILSSYGIMHQEKSGNPAVLIERKEQLQRRVPFLTFSVFSA
jgi:hypothetical protein